MSKEQFALKVLDIYPDRIRFVYHHYPISEYSYLLAELLEFSSQEGKFWELHDRLLENVPSDQAELDVLVASMNFDADNLKMALENYEYRERVDLAKKEADARGVTDTSLFINGREYQKHPGTFDDFLKAIEAELESVGGGK